MEKKKMVFLFLLLLLVLVAGLFYLRGDGLRLSPSLTRDVRDSEGNVYETITVGEQIWLAENLNSAVHDKGESWCYENEEENCEIYGRLYDWDAAMTICPDGWSLPSDDDWKELENYGGGDEKVGAKLKAEDSWKVRDEEVEEEFEALDEYGLGFLPGGQYFDEYFYELGFYGFWWSSTAQGDDDSVVAWSMSLSTESDDVNFSSFGKEHGFSVRCLKKAN